MEAKEEGNKAAEVKDAFSLSEEDFKAALSTMTDDAEEAAPVMEEEEDTDLETTEETESAEGESSDDADTEEPADTGQEAREPKFDLGRSEDRKLKITHNGQQLELTEKEVVSLAQKGFSADKKFAEIAKHKRLIELIEQDDTAKQLLDQHFRKKFGIDQKVEVKPYDREKDDPDTWLKENLSAFEQRVRQNVLQEMQAQRPQPRQPNPIEAVGLALQKRDPQNFDRVVQAMPKYKRYLTVEQHEMIQKDFDKLCSFYDQVAVHEGLKPQEKPKVNPSAPAPPLRIKPSGTKQDAKPKDGKNVWEMSSKKFKEELARAGYHSY